MRMKDLEKMYIPAIRMQILQIAKLSFQAGYLCKALGTKTIDEGTWAWLQLAFPGTKGKDDE